MLLRIVSSYFVAGYDMVSGRIAPIIRYMKGWPVVRIMLHCRAKGWQLQVIDKLGR